MAGAERLAEIIPTFSQGHAVIGVCGAPFKCPPAPSECALLLDEELTRARGARRLPDLVRDPAAAAGAALAGGLGGAGSRVRRARHRADHRPPRQRARSRRASVAVLDDGSELPFDLFLGVPKHRAPEVVHRQRHDRGRLRAGRLRRRCETRFPGVYAVGDVATAGVPKAGVFAEGAAEVVAQALIAKLARRRAARPPPRARHLLHRVRPRPGRQRRHRLPLGPRADRDLQPALGRAWSPRRNSSAPAAAPAGSVPEPIKRDRITCC